MKKTFIKISAFATIGLVLASCNNEEANNKLREADDLAVQELVNAKELELDAAVWAECDAKVLEAAEATVAANAKKVAVKPKPKPAPAPAPVVAKEEPKVDVGSTTYRPGATKSGEVKTTTERPGATKSGEVKTTTERPGATKK